MRSNALQLTFVCTLAIGMTGAARAVPTPATPPDFVRAALHEAVDETCAMDCPTDQCAFEGWHEYVKAPSTGSYMGGVFDQHGCDSRSCESHNHDTCEPTLASGKENLPALWAAAVTGDEEGVKEALERAGNNAWFNAERKSLQVRGCNGLVMANIPVPADLASKLAD